MKHHKLEFNVSEQVRTLRFENYWIEKLQKAHIDICKMDVEGHELDVLSGFGEAIHHIDVIQFEFGGCNIDTRTFFQDFWYFFKEYDFEIYRITPFGPTKIKKYTEELEFFNTTNFIAKKI
ncbi:FkbM family methyltransferase [Roseibium salinum]|uniref:FkbM family methyltransferase n=1 Tax=Roseibium salinum TaxID=1604349 RepID=UPI0035ED4774